MPPYPIIRIFALTRHVLVGLQQQHKNVHDAPSCSYLAG